MSIHRGPKIVTNGLVLALDAGSTKSYPGTGNTWFDRSGNNYNGTLTNGPTFNSANGGTILFDGTDDYVSINADTTLKTLQVPMTILCWAKPTTSKSYMAIFSQYSDVVNNKLIKLIRLDSNIFRCFSSKSDGTYQYFDMSISPTLNSWNFFSFIISGTLSSASVIMGLNGVFENKGTFASALSSNPDMTVPVYIGTIANNYLGMAEYFQGNIANTLIYNRALSTSEVLQNFNAQRNRFGI